MRATEGPEQGVADGPERGADGGRRGRLDRGEDVGLRGRGAGQAHGGEALLAGPPHAGRCRHEHEHGHEQADGADAEDDAEEVGELELDRLGRMRWTSIGVQAAARSSGVPDDGDEVVGPGQVVVADRAGRGRTGSGRRGGRRAARP